MSKLQTFIGTLEEEREEALRVINQRKDEGVSEDEIIQDLIFDILWDYKTRTEYSETKKEGLRLYARKRELYNKWKELGFV